MLLPPVYQDNKVVRGPRLHISANQQVLFLWLLGAVPSYYPAFMGSKEIENRKEWLIRP